MGRIAYRAEKAVSEVSVFERLGRGDGSSRVEQMTVFVCGFCAWLIFFCFSRVHLTPWATVREVRARSETHVAF